MKKSGVIVVGSARSNGNTNKVAVYLQGHTQFDLIDLKQYHINQYDYDNANEHDDFIPLVKDILEKYDLVVFATPIYWYAMSGIMKTFFDRLTDCLKQHKPLGKKFKGKDMAMLSCGSGSELKIGFDMPFKESANYLSMNYVGDVHAWLENDEIPKDVKRDLKRFGQKLLSS